MSEGNPNPNPEPTPSPEPTPEPTPDKGWSGPSQEEWQALVDGTRQIQKAFAEFEEPEDVGPQVDLGGLDLTNPEHVVALMEYVADERLKGVTPYVRNAAQDQGQRRMESLLSEHEAALKEEYPDGFDHQLAHRAAFAFFDETQDPDGSVEMAARYAAETRKQERESAIESYRKSNRRGAAMSDLSVEGEGIAAAPKFKSYDEVMEKYVPQTEV